MKRKTYFQTTFLDKRTPPKFCSIGSKTLKFNTLSPIYIPAHKQAYDVANYDFLTFLYHKHYKIITLYLNGIFLKCI